MKKGFAILLAGALLLAACSNVEQVTPGATQITQASASSATPEPTNSPTLEPTVTSTPAPQNSPTPEPIFPYDTEAVSVTTEEKPTSSAMVG